MKHPTYLFYISFSLGHDVIDICSNVERQMFRVGFVSSPEYPNPYAGDMDCTCNITTARDQNLLVSFADFDLEWSENCEKDLVMVSDDGQIYNEV